jgi:hypothetical protein
LLLADEVQRRDHQALERHLQQAGFEDRVVLDGFDWSAPILVDRPQVQALFSLDLLRPLNAQQSQDLYELSIERHRRSSFAFTSNRGVDGWLGLFDDPILGNSAFGPPGECGARGGHRRLQLPRQARAKAEGGGRRLTLCTALHNIRPRASGWPDAQW